MRTSSNIIAYIQCVLVIYLCNRLIDAFNSKLPPALHTSHHIRWQQQQQPQQFGLTSFEHCSTRRRVTQATVEGIEGFEAPESVLQQSQLDAASIDEADFVIIGSGIGGLSCAALLKYYGYSVVVLESHYLPGGVAHTFERNGFKFDAGPSLWNGMSTKPFNPLREILEIIGEGDSVQYAKYDGWMMHIPEGSFKFKVGAGNFEPVIERFGGQQALLEWQQLLRALLPVQRLATAIPPLVLRSDAGVVRTLLPHLGALLMGAPVAARVQGPFKNISKKHVKSPFLENWLEFLSFALSGLPADGTIAAAVAYTMRDLHQSRAALDYPIGGAAAVVDALVRGVEQRGDPQQMGKVLLNCHVQQILVQDGRAVGVQLRQRGSKNNNNSNNNSNNSNSNSRDEDKKSGKKEGKVIRAKRAVISNASIWDTMRLLPAGALPEQTMQRNLQTPMTGSFVHLHLGIDATGLPADLESHYSVVNHWDKIDAPQNHVIISIPSVLDPTLAPPGCHVIHAYAAANEPFELWSERSGSREEYEAKKRDRCEFLFAAIERSIPDVRSRVLLELLGSPLTHQRFNRRFNGTYGPALRAGEQQFPYPQTALPGLLMCGDSVFPGIGVPAVAASGANAANSAVSVGEHLQMLQRLYSLDTQSPPSAAATS